VVFLEAKTRSKGYSCFGVHNLSGVMTGFKSAAMEDAEGSVKSARNSSGSFMSVMSRQQELTDLGRKVTAIIESQFGGSFPVVLRANGPARNTADCRPFSFRHFTSASRCTRCSAVVGCTLSPMAL
jgi:hypothetical protein